MQLFLILLKLLLSCFIVVLFFYVIGKSGKELNIIDLMILFLLSNIIINSNSLFVHVIVAALIIIYKLINKYVIPIIPTIKYMLFNKRSLIIKNGKLNFNEMIKRQYKINDLLNELENRNIKRIEDVDYAVLGPNSLLIKNNKEAPIPIIWDGRIDYLSLKLIHKNINWIIKIIKKENISLENIFYAFYKQKKVYIIQNK